jgi:hypothetical protein
MNPYLEQADVREDFHTNFITHSQALLSGQVGPSYYVKVEVHLILHELSAEERRLIGKGDVGLSLTNKPAPGVSGTTSSAAPFRLTLPGVEIERHRFLEIRDRRDRKVVTIVELLSPSNKTGADREDYLIKRRRVLSSPTHLVEIDLRRGGLRPDAGALPACDYYVLVSRQEARPMADLWPIRLRDTLPVVPIPLAAPDPDVALDLKQALDRAYDDAGYGKYIYSETPEPPLSAEDAAWAKQFLPQLP